MYMKFGRRLVMIITLVLFVAGLAGCSAAQTYEQLMALRVLQSFGSGVCEALPVQVVNEIVLPTPNISNSSFSSTNVPPNSVSIPWLYVWVPLAPSTQLTCLTVVIPGDCTSGCASLLLVHS